MMCFLIPVVVPNVGHAELQGDSMESAHPKGYPWRLGRDPGNSAFYCRISPEIPGVALYR